MPVPSAGSLGPTTPGAGYSPRQGAQAGDGLRAVGSGDGREARVLGAPVVQGLRHVGEAVPGRLR